MIAKVDRSAIAWHARPSLDNFMITIIPSIGEASPPNQRGSIPDVGEVR
jgi:hypothetical protein